MSRITEETVAAAARQLVEAGEKPSVRKVTALLGGGSPNLVAPLLKAIDATYVMNSERTFQARNAKAYEVELLVAPSLVHTLPNRDWPKPVPLPDPWRTVLKGLVLPEAAG